MNKHLHVEIKQSILCFITLIGFLLLPVDMIGQSGVSGDPEESAVSEGDTITVGVFKYEILPDNKVSVVGVTNIGNACDVLPSVSYGGVDYKVTSIGDYAFEGLNIEKTSLPEGLIEIGGGAYLNCTSLKYVLMPSSLKAIGWSAFEGCTMLETVQLNEGLQVCSSGAFKDCSSLVNFYIPASVEGMYETFEGCTSLAEIVVSDENTHYSSYAGILYDKAQTTLLCAPSNIPGVESFPETLKTVASGAFYMCKNVVNIVLPEGVEKIEEVAFSRCSATSITIPSTIKTLEMYVFGDSNTDKSALEKLYCHHIDPSLITIDNKTFGNIDFSTCTLSVPKGTKALYATAAGWKDFKNIIEEGDIITISFTIGQLQYEVTAANEVMITGVTDKTLEYFDIKPSVTYEGTTYNVTAVGERAFEDCRNLVRFQPERVKMPLKTIGKEAFRGCEKLTNLLFGSTLETIEDGAFMKCSSLQNLEIPAGVSSIGDGVFDECGKLASIAVNSANQYYTSSNGALYNKNKTTLLVCPNMRGDSYIIPSGVKRIESGAFYYCTNLKSVVLPDGLESIGDCAFDFCTGLRSLTLPASLKSIGLGIVDHCGNTLEEIHSKMVKPLSLGDYPEYAFFYYGDKSDVCVLYVPKGSKEDYLKADGWKAFKNIIEEGDEFKPDIEEVTDSTLTVTWEPVQEATDYILKIYRDVAKTEWVATYTFDANGQMKSTGFSYLLKGLEAGSTYYIETTAVKKVGSETIVLAQNTTAAKTTGISVGNMEITVDKPQIRVAEGQLWIQSALVTNVKVYNLSGYCVYAKQISGMSSIRLSAGMYIVLIGDECYKIVMR